MKTDRVIRTTRLIKMGLMALLVGHPAASQAADEWEGRIGAGAEFTPKFSGSDEYDVSAIPLIDVTWRERYFLSTENGIGVWAHRNDEEPEYLLGFSIGYHFDERDSDDIDGVNGLDDIDGTVEAKLASEYELAVLDLELDVAQALNNGGHDGLRARLGAGIGAPITDTFFVELTPYVTWGDSNDTDRLYGVSDGDAAASDLDAFNADAGFEKAGVELAFNIFATERVGLFINGEYGRLIGDAADSPVVEDKDQFESLAAVYYRL